MPTKHTISKTSKTKAKNKGRWGRLKGLVTGKAQPFLAALIVLGVVGLGYYGYLRSNADSFNNTPPTVTCGKKLTDKECKQKQAESDAKFYAQLEKDCTAANRIYKDNSCGKCQKGYFDNNGTCKQRTKIYCIPEQNRIQLDEYTCGGCKAGYYDAGGYCKQRTKIDCSKENRVQKDDYSCGDCSKGYFLVGDACVTQEEKLGASVCAKVFRNYDLATNKCTTCFDKYVEVDGVCKKKTNTNTPSPDPHSPPVVPPTTEGVKEACAKVHRTYNSTTNTCGDCVTGYTLNGTICQKVLGTQEQCAFNGNGRCMTPEQVKKVCTINHRKYDSKTNSCKDECINGWYMEGNVCNEISTEDPAKVKASCDKLNLRYDRETNRCLDKCKATYVKRDGKCVAWEDAGMTQWRCEALGRVWVPSSVREGDIATRPYCAATCASPVAKYVNTGSDDTSYCKAPGGAAGVGVSVNMTKEECNKQHRAWIGALEGCSARCQHGWYLNNGQCTEVKTPDGDTTDGDGEAGGCSQPLQDGSGVTPDGGVVDPHAPGNDPLANSTVCPDDQPNTPPPSTDQNVPVTHDVAVLMDHETCTLLGRVWVPDANTVNGKKRGGCSTQECIIKTAEVRLSNGSAYCEGSIDRISQADCNKAHRKWMAVVNGCAAIPGAKGVTVNAKQCDPPYTVYVHHPEKLGGDECVKPSTLQKVQGVAKTVGKPVSYLATLPAKGVCNLQTNKQWIDGKCVKQRVPSNNTQPAGGGVLALLRNSYV